MNLFSLIPYTLEPRQWGAVIFSCICFGISKTGLNGISIVAVPLFALVFGARESTGVVLPLICFADLFAVIYYRRHAQWKYIGRLIPWALAGFAMALVTDHFVSSNRGFKILIGICIAAGLVVMVWNERRNTRGSEPPSGWWFSAVFGIMGGFSTMIGNAAGPIMSVFLLSVRLPKESFVGTAAWFFLIVNYLKIPLQAFVWRNISLTTLRFDLFMIPFILLGIWLGILFVKKVSNSQYRMAVYVLTLLSAALLFL
ncbi:MAG: sulfite exporter TauE/SafE family protein [Spirochaetaceae bacterium]|jgi:uncharacterized membrane protein YfcA|nr:sulfite exporter TauE/SafE family protein [Spirochaetaceae bacterium]